MVPPTTITSRTDRHYRGVVPGMLSGMFAVAAESRGTELFGPAFALLGAVLTSGFAFLAARRWPTSGRRIEDHVALLKDLPDDAAGPRRALADLVRQDLARYPAREETWLRHPLKMAALCAERVVILVVVLAWSGLAMTWLPPVHAKPAGWPLVIVGAAASALAMVLVAVGRPAWQDMGRVRTAARDREKRWWSRQRGVSSREGEEA